MRFIFLVALIFVNEATFASCLNKPELFQSIKSLGTNVTKYQYFYDNALVETGDVSFVEILPNIFGLQILEDDFNKGIFLIGYDLTQNGFYYKSFNSMQKLVSHDFLSISFDSKCNITFGEDIPLLKLETTPDLKIKFLVQDANGKEAYYRFYIEH